MRRVIVAMVLATAPALAGAHDDRLLEAGLFAHEDTNYTDFVPNRGNRLAGYRVAWMLGMPTRPFAFFTEYGNTDVIEQFSGGALYRHALAAALDAYAGVTAEFEDMTDEKGYGARCGLRWSPFGDRLELQPELRHEDLFEPHTSLRLTASATVTGPWRVQLAAEGGEEQRYILGLRYALRR
jgi:hypothetical protein